jgi:hypothetical protein
MKLFHSVRSVLSAIAALLALSSMTPVVMADGNCFQCLSHSGCRQACDCTCSSQNLTLWTQGCGEDGNPIVICQNTGAVPPVWELASCTRGWCPEPPPNCSPNGDLCDDDNVCCSGICNDFTGECDSSESPLLINLASDSTQYRLTSAEDGVIFDLNADGYFEQVAWTNPDSAVAFIAMDRNRNGQIDDGTELFGTHSPLRNGGFAANGFEALLDLDGGIDASDWKIDEHDPVYNRLRLWLDRNHNGISERRELLTLREAGITTLFTGYRETNRIDKHGNRYLFQGIALVFRHGKVRERQVFDVVFATN